MVAKGEKKEWRVTMNEDRASFCSDENVLELDSGDICTTLGVPHLVTGSLSMIQHSPKVLNGKFHKVSNL